MISPGVRYELIKRPLDGWLRVFTVHHYELVRVEGDVRQTVVQGEGLEARLRLVTYLREVAELGGPDAAAAIAAMKAGWASVVVPPAPGSGES